MADPLIEGRSVVLDAIRLLAIACRAWAAYPSDHPNVTRALDTVQAGVSTMLAAHGSVGMGVGRADLRVGVWTLDSPQARALADALYQRQVAVLRMDRGVLPEELRALVQWLAGAAAPLEPGSAPVGPPGYPVPRHVHLQPLDYSAVRLTDEAREAEEGAVSLSDRLLNVLLTWVPDDPDWPDEGGGTGSTVPAELAMVRWLTEFLRAQVALERAEAAGGPGPGDGAGTDGGGTGAEARAATGPGGEGAGEPAAEAGPSDAAATLADAGAGGPDADGGPDGAPGGSGPAVGEPPAGPVPAELVARLGDTTTGFLAEMSGAGRALAARQTAQLIMRLPETLRESLMRAALRALAPEADGGEALEAFASTFAAHPVLRVLRQLAAEGVPLSRHAQRLVELLASTRTTVDDPDEPTTRDLDALRGELLTLFREEDIDRYNPEDHLALLARTMLAWPTRTPVTLGRLEDLGERVATLTDDAVSLQLTETCLDLLVRQRDDKAEAVLARLEQLVEGALARGALESAADAVEGLARLAADPATPEATRLAAPASLERLARAETLSVLAAALGAPGAAPAGAVRLMRILGGGAIRSLLQVLVQEQVRVRRRRVFDLLSALGADVVPEATRWLSDSNWFVVRNMIALLRAVSDRSSLPTIRRLTAHPDLRVRLEALRSLLELDPPTGHEFLLRAIADPDPRAVTAAVELAGQHGGPTMMEPLLQLVTGRDVRGRRRAIRLAALQALGRVGRPEALPRLTHFFRERWLPFPSIVERRAAYESLHGYPPDARAAWVARGQRSRDHQIRIICERLRQSG